MFLWVIQRDLLLAMRQRADVLTTLFFFIIVVSLFPLGVGPEINMLRSVWYGLLLY
jgi:heme exporter protein B